MYGNHERLLEAFGRVPGISKADTETLVRVLLAGLWSGMDCEPPECPNTDPEWAHGIRRAFADIGESMG